MSASLARSTAVTMSVPLVLVPTSAAAPSWPSSRRSPAATAAARASATSSTGSGAPTDGGGAAGTPAVSRPRRDLP
jgi:hypothetical protein